MSAQTPDRPVMGILAGRGLFPHLLAERISAAGYRIAVAALKGQFQTGTATDCLAVEVFPVGALGAIARFFRGHGARRCVMAGGVRRAGLSSHLELDRHALSLLPHALARGDNALLRGVADKLSHLGIEVIDARPFLEDLLAPEGLLAGPPVDAATSADLRIAWKGAVDLGMRDRGQAAAALGGRIAGLETRHGTDALIAAVSRPGAVLAKVVKPGQDTRFDLPAIGPDTARLAAAQGFKAIAVQAGGVLLLERERLLDVCRECGISLMSYSAEGPVLPS